MLNVSVLVPGEKTPRFASFRLDLSRLCARTLELPDGGRGLIFKNEAKRGKTMRNEAICVEVSSRLYLDLITQLSKSGDMRTPRDIVNIAVRTWLVAHLNRPSGRGYQWKELFLPAGTELRLRYQRICYYAVIEGDELVYAGENMSPRDWAFVVTGSARNPWRDVWVRRTVGEGWIRACKLRQQNGGLLSSSDSNRRCRARRKTD